MHLVCRQPWFQLSRLGTGPYIFTQILFFFFICVMLRSALYVCMSCVTFVDHVQTDHRKNPILWIGAHLYICNQARSSEFCQCSRNCHFVLDVGLRKNGKSKNGTLDYGVWKCIYLVNMSAS
jgi:hypothetical protein